MRHAALVLVVLAGALGVAAAGCGGEEEASPTPETVSGTLETETTATETTETETTATETTETTETTGATGEGDPVAGKAVFTGSAGCTSCHTLADAGSTGTVGPNLDDAMPSYELVVERVTNGAGAMPPFGDTLSAQQIADVAAYVSSVAGG